jgi:hypothetical protein
MVETRRAVSLFAYLINVEDLVAVVAALAMLPGGRSSGAWRVRGIAATLVLGVRVGAPQEIAP